MSLKEEVAMEVNIIQELIQDQSKSIPHHLIITISSTRGDTLVMVYPKPHQVQVVICHHITLQVQPMEATICLEALLSAATNGIISCMDNRT